MRSLILTSVAAVALAAALAARAGDSQGDSTAELSGWELRARAVYLSPSSAALDYTKIGGNTYPELSAEWALASNWSMEAAIGIPTNYSLSSGSEELRIMPITLTGKYSWVASSAFRPYVGAGLHVTTLSLVNGRAGSASSTSAGWVAQVGMDVNVGGNWVVNADCRKLGNMSLSGTFGGQGRSSKVDPILVGVGISYRWR